MSSIITENVAAFASFSGKCLAISGDVSQARDNWNMTSTPWEGRGPSQVDGNFAKFEAIDRYLRKHFVLAGYRRATFTPPHLRHSKRLTFGLELEMVLEGYSEDQGFEALLQSLKRLYLSGGVRYDAEIPGGVFDRTKFLVMPDNSINHRYSLREGVKIPVIKKDQGSPLAKGLPACGDWGWGEGSSEEDEIRPQSQPQKVKVEKSFSDLGSLEDSCFMTGAPVEFCTPILEQITYGTTLMSLHVHVGCGKGSSWSLEELKAIGKAAILWEVVVDLMHAPHRGKGNWMIASNRWNPELGDLTLVEAVKKIEQSRTIEEFHEYIGKEKFYKYNFSANSKYGTIEFRQAEAYGDGAKATGWVRFISGFVSAALATAKWEWIEWAEAVGRGVAPSELLKLGEKVWERFGVPRELVSSV